MDKNPKLKKARIHKKYILFVGSIATLCIAAFLATKAEIWGYHGNMTGVEHCHELCLQNNDTHCTDISEFFGDYAPGHIH